MKKILRGFIISSSIILGVIAYSYATSVPGYLLTLDDLAAYTGLDRGEIEITWRVPNELSDWQPGVASYEVRYSGSPIDTEEAYNNATIYSQTWTPKAKGELERYMLTGFNPGQLYYISIKATDNAVLEEVPEEIIAADGPPPYEGYISNYDPYTGIGSCAYAIARAEIIGISIEGAYDFGEVSAGGDAISTQSFLVRNIGEGVLNCLLKLKNPPGWTAVQSEPIEHNRYILSVMFNSTRPSEGSFNNSQHALSTTPAECGSSPDGKFAGNEDGVGLSVGEFVYLWVEFKAPQTTSIGSPQKISVCVSAQAYE